MEMFLSSGRFYIHGILLYRLIISVMRAAAARIAATKPTFMRTLRKRLSSPRLMISPLLVF